MIVLLVIVLVVLVLAYLLFRRTMNLFQSVGKLYWITRDNGDGWYIRRGYARATFAPWKCGTGVQFGVGRHTFQVGICHTPELSDPTDEIEGLEYIMGRPYDEF